MAVDRIFNIPINLVGNELRNALIQQLAVSPTIPEAGFLDRKSVV